MRKAAELVTSLFYLGRSPLMPGTLGSAGGLLIYFLVKENVFLYAFAIAFTCVLGFIFSGEAEKIYAKKDARMIVIDEACGMLLSLFLVPYSLFMVITGFVIFRVFDILKPPPARYMETFAGGLGVMGDDIIAAIYTNVILQAFFRVMGSGLHS